ncbi:hypothetical protein BWD42_09010 [Sphingobacterium sp. CZ-UAM]|nr:hypothetical protein BWD42_09010 [Sphingobacterium sp. CZ-UAM]
MLQRYVLILYFLTISKHQFLTENGQDGCLLEAVFQVESGHCILMVTRSIIFQAIIQLPKHRCM